MPAIEKKELEKRETSYNIADDKDVLKSVLKSCKKHKKMFEKLAK